MRFLRAVTLFSLVASSVFALQYTGGLDIGVQKAWLDRWVIETPLVGINVPVFITDEQGVQLSLRYSPKGYENDSGIGYKSDWLQYLDIPLCYIYYPEFFPIDLGLTLGINYSFLLGVSAKEPDGFEASNEKQYYENSDFGILVGVHYKKPITYGFLVFSLEYYHGIKTVRETWPMPYEGVQNRPVKNHALSVSLGYELPRFGSGAAPVKKDSDEGK
jgi:hypothetical protein